MQCHTTHSLVIADSPDSACEQEVQNKKERQHEERTETDERTDWEKKGEEAPVSGGEGDGGEALLVKLQIRKVKITEYNML